jgi:hypothetical protein
MASFGVTGAERNIEFKTIPLFALAGTPSLLANTVWKKRTSEAAINRVVVFMSFFVFDC